MPASHRTDPGYRGVSVFIFPRHNRLEWRSRVARPSDEDQNSDAICRKKRDIPKKHCGQRVSGLRRCPLLVSVSADELQRRACSSLPVLDLIPSTFEDNQPTKSTAFAHLTLSQAKRMPGPCWDSIGTAIPANMVSVSSGQCGARHLPITSVRAGQAPVQ